MKIIQNSDDDGVPRFDDNRIPSILLLNDTLDKIGAQNTAILNLSNEPNFSSPIKQNTIIESLQFLNEHHRILNVEKFGELNAETVSVVIVVQV